ncbi:unnamed protein product [Rotaria sp. Silwood2]|nr:unnamed protein product [Rotaria sp. Silwood2]
MIYFFLEWDKERNLFQDYINSLRKEIRVLLQEQTDTKSQISIINELTENVTDLNVDLQNHILIKQRSEMSINNLEHNCQLLDTEQNLQQEYLQLLKKDNEKLQLKLELNTYKLEIKRLYSHFNINIDSIEQLIPTLEDRLLQTSSISSTSELNNEYEQLEKILQI